MVLLSGCPGTGADHSVQERQQVGMKKAIRFINRSDIM